MKEIFLENISDLAESQRASFFNFLHKGISAELKLLENPLPNRINKRKPSTEDFEEIEPEDFELEKIDSEVLKEIESDGLDSLNFKKKSKAKSKSKIENKDFFDQTEINNNTLNKLNDELEIKEEILNKSEKLNQYTKKVYEKFKANLDEKISFDKSIFNKIDLDIERNEIKINETLVSDLEKFLKKRTKELDLYFFPEEIKIKGPYESLQSAQLKHMSYCLQIFVTTYHHKDLSKIRIEQDYLLAELPLITDEGTFLITGYERIVVNQIIRSPGVYFRKEYSSSKLNPRIVYTATVISDKGIWTKIIMSEDKDGKDNIYVKLNDLRGKSALSKGSADEKNKFSLFYFLQYFRISFEEIFDTLSYPEDRNKRYEFIQQIYKLKMDPLEIQNILRKTFYSAKTGCFSLGEIGRFKMNKRLALNLPKQIKYVSSQDILIILNKLLELKYSNPFIDDIDHIKNKQIRSIGDFLRNQFRIGLYKSFKSEELYNEGTDIYRFVKYEAETIGKNDEDRFVHRHFCDPYPVSSSLKEFFKASQLSQFMDQVNPLSELTQKRRVSVFGPNGLKRDHISTVIRDIHPSQYGRLCPVETPEGQNAGLVASLALHSRISSLGWLETPYCLIKNGNLETNQKILYLNPEQESQGKIAFCDTSISKDGKINAEYLSVKEDISFTTQKRAEVRFLSLSPLQLLSVATTLIPFMEHDDANRALMGSNMQRQAVPLLYPQKAIVGTGLETTSIIDSGMVIKTYSEGYVKMANACFIEILDMHSQSIKYYLQKYFRSNQETCINQKANVWEGEKVFSGQIIADGSSTIDGELALGRNLTVAYMPWEGYNYEDAIVLNERLVLDNCLTSIHIEEYETTVPEFFENNAERKLNLQALPARVRRNLDKNGVIKIGSYVNEYDILFGKVVRSQEDLTGQQKLALAIKGNQYSVKDASFKMPPGAEGRVIEIRLFHSSLSDYEASINKEVDQDNPEVQLERLGILKSSKKMKFFIAQTRKIQIGDKLAGRHGNKGIISRILPRQDMPYLPDGRPVDILFNPLGVPSRMNVGQIFECLLGLAGENLGKRFKVKSFDEIYGREASRILVSQKLKEASIKQDLDWLFSTSSPGKIFLRDGRTGEFFDNPITIGKSYILKLIHLVKDKIHARDTGPYSMITEQPLAGKSQQGGQRLGEMEVWALEAYGASYTLQELLTIKSDDIDARMDVYESIVVRNFKEKPSACMPEGFLLLIRELNALGLEFSLKKLKGYQDYDNNGQSKEKDAFVNIFDEMEKRLKLRAIYHRKKFEIIPLKKARRHEDKIHEYKMDKRNENKIKVFEALKKADFSALLRDIEV